MPTAARPIETDRLRLVPLRLADVEPLFPLARDPKTIEDFQTVAESPADVESWVREAVETETLSWTVRRGDRVIGLVETDPRRGTVAEIGFFVDAALQGRGFGTEATGAMVEWVFRSTEFHRLQAGITACNRASRRLVEKLGFRLEGIGRRDWPWKGEWHDSARYALLREEWVSRRDPERDTPPRVHATRHVLAVRNLERSAAHYLEVLGFTREFRVEGWEFLRLGGFRVMLGECPDEVPAAETGNHSYFAQVLVEDVDALHEAMRARGAAFTQGIADKPWGLREFGVVTPDGHRILFAQDLEP